MCIGVPAAIIGGVTGVKAIVDGVGGAIAGNAAADAQMRGIAQAIEQINKSAANAKEIFQPYVSGGNAAVQEYLDLIGLGQRTVKGDPVVNQQRTDKYLNENKSALANTLTEQGFLRGLLDSGNREAIGRYYVNSLGGDEAAKKRVQFGGFDDKGFAEEAAAAVQKRYDQTLKDQQAYGSRIDAVGRSPLLDPTYKTIGGEEIRQQKLKEIYDSPAFQQRLKMSNDAILANASATGGLRGGDTQRFLAENAPMMLDDEVNRRLGMMGPILGMGFNASGNVAGADQNAASMIASLLNQQGNVGAQKALLPFQGASTVIGGLGQAAGSAYGMQMMQDLYNNGGGIPAPNYSSQLPSNYSFSKDTTDLTSGMASGFFNGSPRYGQDLPNEYSLPNSSIGDAYGDFYNAQMRGY